METNNNNESEWVSVSSLAKTLGVSKQTVYNKIKQGLYEVNTFERGKMRGILVRSRQL